MKIVVEGIPAAGRDVALGLGLAWAVEAAAVALDAAPERLSGTIELRRASTKGVVVVDVKAAAATSTTCDRCGEGTERGASVDVRLLYGPEEKGSAAYDSGEIELELEAKDLDLGWYAQGELDLGDVLREALTLALPTRTTCADVQGCDKRTDALLGATRASSDPFAVLRGWKPEDSEG